jgi:hypothetical protein
MSSISGYNYNNLVDDSCLIRRTTSWIYSYNHRNEIVSGEQQDGESIPSLIRRHNMMDNNVINREIGVSTTMTQQTDDGYVSGDTISDVSSIGVDDE